MVVAVTSSVTTYEEQGLGCPCGAVVTAQRPTSCDGRRSSAKRRPLCSWRMPFRTTSFIALEFHTKAKQVNSSASADRPIPLFKALDPLVQRNRRGGLQCPATELDTCRETELGHDMADVVLYRLLRYAEFSRHLLV